MKNCKIISFSIAFIMTIILGTISHEFGHFSIAKSLGYDAVLKFDKTLWSGNTEVLDTIYSEYKHEIDTNLSFPKAYAYKIAKNKLKKDSFYIALGGILVTLLLGTIGLVTIAYQRRISQRFGIVYWFGVFLSLFWAREIINLTISISKGIVHKNGRYFGGDESEISQALNFHEGAIPIALGIISLTIIAYIYFRAIPKDTRIGFFLSGIIGTFLAYIGWFILIGPIILP